MHLSAAERKHFKKILKKYLSGTASPLETEFVEIYYNYFQQQPNVSDTFSNEEKHHLQEEIRQLLLKDMTEGDTAPVYSLPQRKIGWKLSAAAILLLIAGTFIYTFLTDRPSKETALNLMPAKQQDIAAGGNKALLTLADGTTILLDSAADGAIAQQGNTRIIKLNSGALAYKGNRDLTAAADIPFNTISTPKGGQYKIMLPDGSNVWLNASSYIKFPIAFVKERKVEISGEVYFEIAKDKSKPFRVTVDGTEVQVLGTSFNVNAYKEDGESRTTLLEGSVKVLTGKAERLLQPGEQAQVTSGNILNVVKNVNTADIMAWKNGLFYFNTADIKTFMRQLERWYDIEVKYEGTAPDLYFNGKMQRNLNLSQLLKILDRMEVHFKMEGRTLTILP